MRFARVLPFLASVACGEEVHSPTRIYKICDTVVEGDNGLIYKVVSYGKSENPIDCSEQPMQILKCTGPGEESAVDHEYATMNQLAGVEWIPTIFEYFERAEGGQCYVMEELGMDLQTLRKAYPKGTQWSWITLGSIGARTVELVKSLHQDHHVINTDLHPGNWMLTKSEEGSAISSSLKMIDFGYAMPTSHKKAPARFLEEIRQQVIALRYFLDADFKFYVWKRYEFNEAEICANVPETFCDALKYVRDLEEGDEIDYDRVHRYMTAIMEQFGGIYTGEIDWEPVVAAHGLP
jgi:hypothetical protein